MKTLVLAEKPSVGRDIGRVLHCTPQGNGFLEGKDYIVTWGLGHLVTLKDPEGYDKKYKEWKMEELPIVPKKLETEVIRQTAKQFQTVKKQVQRQDVKEIVIATDAGREGELVARWILKEARNQKPCRRLWVSSVTDKAIRDGFAHLKNSKEYDPLYRAAVSRAEADWLVGINATRALTCKYNAQLSCGRVQTPTLAMIQARENEIHQFVPESYYTITAKADGITFTWKEGKTGSLRTYQKERAEEIKKEELEKARQSIRAELRAKSGEYDPIEDLTDTDYVLPRPLVKGDTVLIMSIGQTGTVLSPADKNGMVRVQAGRVMTRTEEKNLKLIEKQSGAVQKNKDKRAYKNTVVKSFSPELDIRGMYGDDACFMLDKYLDDAALAGIHTVRIIHGKGTGALKAAVWQFLRGDRRVESYRLGSFGEGDAGVTVVEVK